MPPNRCKVTMAGNNFMVTVSAPNAPCRQTQIRVKNGQPYQTFKRLRSIQLTALSTRINTPTAVAK